MENTRAILFLFSGIISISTGALAQCITETEMKADQKRFIQTQMMVAALQCRRGYGGVLPQIYNDFVKNNRLELQESERILSTYLQRDEKLSVTAYLTSIANKVSLESVRQSDFCGKMKVAGEMALSMKDPLPVITVLPVHYKIPKQLCEQPAHAMLFGQK
ncbi:hypothetical protein QGN29_13585 [Temperatibacter marinus]|uniref:Uncharacterized protein n=1 Tax=Temperatibacter marinus TaxID=1456591 RepID=A0AA52EHU3_9PROT|nr:hypothetical protein [Temperatibacter marinus]WND02579.1 hypothetical protein QGN29_13585 [Temperatibacter marinus]